MIPDAEQILGDYLRAHPDVSALTSRVVARTPSNTDLPWVRVSQLDARGAFGSRTDHLISFLVQFDCYADLDNERQDASLLGRTVRAALHTMPGDTYDGAVVTSVKFAGDLPLPDATFEPARERRVLTATIHMHEES